MNTRELNWRSLLVGFVMGSAALLAAIMMLANLGLIRPDDLGLETNRFVGYVLVVVLATSSVGGSLWGYELSHRNDRRSTGSFFLVIAAALLAMLLAPERSSMKEASQHRDAKAEYWPLIEYAKRQVRNADPRGAIQTLMHASEVARDGELDRASHCLLGAEAADIAGRLMVGEYYKEAAISYAVAVSHAKVCPHLDRDQLATLRGIAQAKAVRAHMESAL
jgi:hypothetical protein